MAIHNHNAAITGTKGERILKEYLQSRGFSLLNKKSEFEERGMSRKGKKVFPSPYDSGTFLSDGFIPELGYIVEYKYGTNHGTTEEKIFFDLEKIRDRVYGEEYPLVYIFWGTPEKSASKGTNRCWARVFDEKVKKENLPVEVVFATTDDGLEKWIESKSRLN